MRGMDNDRIFESSIVVATTARASCYIRGGLWAAPWGFNEDAVDVLPEAPAVERLADIPDPVLLLLGVHVILDREPKRLWLNLDLISNEHG